MSERRLVRQRRERWKREDVQKLWGLVQSSRDRHEKFYDLCKNLQMLVKKGHTGELDKLDEAERVVINLAHAHVKAKLPMIFFREPTVVSKPTHPRHEGKDKTWSAVLNNTITRIGFKKEIKDIVLDAIVYPEGWAKIFLSANAPDEDSLQGGEVPKDAVIGPMSEASGNRGPQEWLGQGFPFVPAISRINPRQVVVDYLSPDRSIDRARFVDVMYARSLDELKADPLYDLPEGFPTDADLTGSDGSTSFLAGNKKFDPFDLMHGVRRDEVAAHDQFVILHEIWIHQIVGLRLYKQLVCLVEGADGIIFEKPVRFASWEEVLGGYSHRYPLERLVLNPVPDELPNSELGTWSSLHSAMNWLLSRQVQFIENQRQLFTYEEDALVDEDLGRQQFWGAKPRGLIKVRPGKGGGIQPIENHLSTRDDSQLFNIVLEMSRRVSGLSENKLGADNFRTATAAAQAARSDAIKIDEAIDTVRDFLVSVSYAIARRILFLTQITGNTEFVFRIAGDTGAVDWVTFTPEQIAWMPEVDIDVSSFTKPTKEEQAQKGLMALQAAQSTFAMGVPSRLDILLRNVLDALEIPEAGKVIDNMDDQMLLQMVEIGQMLLGAEPEINENDAHAVHIQAIQMFRNSASWDLVEPEIQNAIITHGEAHEEAVRQQAESGPGTAGQNPFDFNRGLNGAGAPTQANLARSETARERESSRPAGGTGGQF